MLYLIYTTNKISSFFTLKDAFLREILSNIVYTFDCASCNACYIGKTTKRYIERVREHLLTDKNSSVYKHLHGEYSNSQCRESNDETSFSILDSPATKYQLSIKEAMYINKLNPSLINKQKKMKVELAL